jgi:hypothetical protein
MADGLTNPSTLSPEVQAAIEEGARRSATATTLRELVAAIESLQVTLAPLVERTARIDTARALLLETAVDTARKPLGYGALSVEVRTLTALVLLLLLLLAGLSWLGVDTNTALQEGRRWYVGECVDVALSSAGPSPLPVEGPE